MNNSKHRISLDIHCTHSQVQIPIKKGDSKRELIIILSDGGKPYAISSECTATFRAKKPDGTVIYNSCAISGNVISHVISSQTTAVEGVLPCEITIYGTDYAIITSPRFELVVEDTLYSDSEVESGSEYTGLTAVITTEAARVAAETARASAESSRATAETRRVSAETARVIAEINRATKLAGLTVSASGLASGRNPTAVVNQTVDSLSIAFGIPRGVTGAKGDPGDQGIQGEKGEKGDKGDKGEKGDKGDPADLAIATGTIFGGDFVWVE